MESRFGSRGAAIYRNWKASRSMLAA